ncbi:hypothetical protein [Micromonospora sp. NPDC049645]|uniref:hypothetical protein n=1 Tax=Micromonospora sp. NPDC049645 TaxID=3155508 RepID=UPI0034175757
MNGPARKPRAGKVPHLTRAAGVQFPRPIFVRVIRVLDRPTYDGWLWIDGYRLAANGDAVARWRGDAVARWRGDAATRRRGGAVARWRADPCS